jgi:hypothetical protein
MDGHADPNRAAVRPDFGQQRPLRLQRSLERTRRCSEHGTDSVTNAAKDDSPRTADRLGQNLVVPRQHTRHLIRAALPETGAPLDIGVQK